MDYASKTKTVVLGANGLVGQKIVHLLRNHPYFVLAGVSTGDPKKVGKKYGEVVEWSEEEGIMPPDAALLVLQPSAPGLFLAVGTCVAISALPTSEAREVETNFARAGFAVFSNSSAHRMDPHVPLLIPEVNADHIAPMIAAQRQQLGSRGFIVCNPNCTSTGLVMALAALKKFVLGGCVVTTMQAVSGAGRSADSVRCIELLDNVIPNVAKGDEEAKLRSEPRKMLGLVQQDGTVAIDANFELEAQTNRVMVLNGHTVDCMVELKQRPSVEQVVTALREFHGSDDVRRLPTAPRHAIEVRMETDRPQPRLDRGTGCGMTAVVGQVQACAFSRALPLTHKFVVVSHNVMRGAAGAALLNAELLYARSMLPCPTPQTPLPQQQ